ncbi:hypothetical protein ACWC98_17525 [Streptomyces goshikiensis]
MTNTTALALAVAVAALPALVWTLRLAPRRHTPAPPAHVIRTRFLDANGRPLHGSVTITPVCPTCPTLAAQVDALRDRLAVAEGWVEEDPQTPDRHTEGPAQ